MSEIVNGVVRTDSGMCLIWNPRSFAGITDFESWERELFEEGDLQRHILAGEAVPINIRSDGAFALLARVGTDEIAERTERETIYTVVSSDPYLFRSDGEACASGIEHVSGQMLREVLRIPIPPGQWSVCIHLIDWKAESGSSDESGHPLADALPDFVVLFNIASRDERFRSEIVTFA
jgi:hypothetical protein